METAWLIACIFIGILYGPLSEMVKARRKGKKNEKDIDSVITDFNIDNYPSRRGKL